MQYYVFTCYKAQDCIDRFEYELAQKFCQRALETDSDNVRALEMSGSLLIDLGNLEAAKHVGSNFKDIVI